MDRQNFSMENGAVADTTIDNSLNYQIWLQTKRGNINHFC